MDIQPSTYKQTSERKGILIGMVNNRGMVTIPKALRDKYQIEPNSLVVFDPREEHIAIKKQFPKKEELAGMFTAPDAYDIVKNKQLIAEEAAERYNSKFE